MARQGTGRRFRLLYGIAATGAFLFALPVAAWAITAAQCTGGGGFVSINVCVGGAFSGQTITGGSNSSLDDRTMSRSEQTADDESEAEDKASEDADKDPWIGFTSIRDKGSSLSSASGAVTGTNFSSHTSEVSAGADMAFNQSKAFNLAADQRLVLGVSFRYDSLHSTYNASAAVPGIGTAGTMAENLYNFSGTAAYRAGNLYFGEILRGAFGNGSLNNNLAGSTGRFDVSQFSSDSFVGKVFTLFDSRTTRNPALPTKAPPKPIDGYAVQLDLRAHLIYGNSWDGGFTDTTGFVSGAEQYHSWTAGGVAQLSAIIPKGDLTWTPFVAATFDQQFGYSDSLGIPNQPGQTADTINFGGPQTFLGVRAGVDVRQVPGWDLGVQGFYKESSEFRIAGGLAFLRYYVNP